jgi:hypothetical protein
VDRNALQTTILVVCVISIILLGGTTLFALEYLQISIGVGLPEEGGSSQGEEDDENHRRSFDSDFLPSMPARHWFLSFDQQFLKPMFSKYIDVGLEDLSSRRGLLRNFSDTILLTDPRRSSLSSSF